MAVHIHPSSYVVVRLCSFGKVAARVADVPNGAFDRPKLHALYRPKFTRLCMCIRPWFFGEGMADMDSWQVGSDILPQGLIRNFLRSAALGSPRYESLWQFR